MKILVEWVLAVGLGSSFAAAQSTEADISARLIGKPLYLRGMWSNDKLKFAASGAPGEKYKQVSWTQSGFDAKTVTLKGGSLVVEGVRVGTAFSEEGEMNRIELPHRHGERSPEKVHVEIEGASNGDFKSALDAIFVDSFEALSPTLPAAWQSYLHKQHPHELADEDTFPAAAAERPNVAQAVPKSAPDASQRAVNLGPPAKPAMRIGGGAVKPPRVLHSTDPAFTDTARAVGYSGNVLVQLIVDEAGMPTHLTIQRAAGLGLDEKALEAVSSYRFTPATLNGKPVRVELSVEVNFQIFN